jgi:protein gp37
MENSHIQWTDHTFNPWEGCTKVSPGCEHCYAEARNVRFAGGKNWGKGAPRRRTSVNNWRQPLKWDRDARIMSANAAAEIYDSGGTNYHRPRVFCASLADWLDDEVQIEWLADLLKLIHDTPNLDWLLLTKRPENWNNRIQSALWKIEGLEPDDDGDSEDLPATETGVMLNDWIGLNPPPNVWVGTTIENQFYADKRIPQLLQIPARVRFLSCEPLLEDINFPLAAPCGYYCECDSPNVDWPNGHRPGHGLTGIHWVICGGESGAGARDFHVDWARSLRDQCAAAGVPFFMKQMGANSRGNEMDKWVTRLSKKGGDMAEWPQELRVRQFPKP